MGGAIISQFFKIVLEQTLQDGKIKIPARFVEEHGDVMQGKIHLEVPTGLVWNVKLSNRDGEVWMQDGWKEFAEHYSLCYGHFLVFRYEGNCRFRVIVFDKSASEIDYPFGNSESRGGFPEQSMEKDDGDDVSVEILDSDSGCSKRKEISSHLDCDPPQKITKTRSNCRTARNSTFAQVIQDSGVSRPSKTELDPSRKHKGSFSIAQRGQTENPLKNPFSCRLFSADRIADNALQKAQAFRSENPFFMILMKHYHIYSSPYKVCIPVAFAKLYFTRKSAEVILRVSRKTWRVKYTFAVYGGKKIPRFQRNWRSFVQENNLSIGDVCVFELLKGRQIILDVTIFRAMGKQCNSLTPESANAAGMNKPCQKTGCGIKAEAGPSGNNGRIKAQNFLPVYDIQESDDEDDDDKDYDDDDDDDDDDDEDYDDDYSSMEILYEKTCGKKGGKMRRRRPEISENAKKHSTGNNGAVEGHNQEISSDLEYYPPQKIMRTHSNCRTARNSTSAQVTQDSGHSIPSKDSGHSIPSKRDAKLKTSSCKRDPSLKEKEPPELDPSRKHNGSSSIAKRGQTENPRLKPQLFSANQKADALQKAQDFRSENPFFMILMKHYHIFDFTYKVNIPFSFAKLYFKGESAEVILRVSGKTWKVKYTLKVYGRKKYSWFANNWRSFIQDNNLSVGDVCVFELIKGRQIILDITIFRAMEKQCNSLTPESANGTAMNQPCRKTDCRTKAEADLSGNNGRIKAQNFLPVYDIQESDYDDDDSSMEVLYGKTCSKKGGKSRRRLLKISKNAEKLSTGNNGAVAGHNRNPSCLRNKQVIEDSDFTSERPSFEAVLEKSNFSRCSVHVPVWIMDMIERGDENAILRAEGGSWPVRLIRNKNSGFLSAGWAKFSGDNCLEQGDVCVFELIKTGNVELKVSILRRSK